MLVNRTKNKLKKEVLKRGRRIKRVAFFGLFVLAILMVALGGYSVVFAKTAYLNIKIGNIDLGGKSRSQVEAILKRESEQFLKNPIILSYQPLTDDERLKLDAGATPAPAKDYQINLTDIGATIDIDKSVERIMAVGRSGGALKSLGQQILSIFWSQKIEMVFTVNEEILSDKISKISNEIDQPEKDYALKYQEGKFVLETERRAGYRVSRDGLISNIKYQITNLLSKNCSFRAEVYEPRITERNANLRLADGNKIIEAGELSLVYDDQKFSLDVDTIAGMISSKPSDDDLEIYIIAEKIQKQVSALATEINQEPENAVLSASGGAVIISKISKTGRELDQAQAILNINNAIQARFGRNLANVDTKTVRLPVTLKKPEIDSTEIGNYGIKELVARGETSFIKSPANRVHNITVGANAINGVLIAPGEEFSTLGQLGKIDASTGYLPELVIKENRTVPEYGGGLCQVSTTLFRASLNAGMEITARQNHKYRVSYYEPPVGMDATIYDPAPDFKFKNNYVSHILIQSKIIGTKISFEFYGTKDDRVVEIGIPDVYDYTNPEAPIETPTDTLVIGERKQLEKGHQGASARFHYKVSKGGAVLQEIDFFSKYVAWPERWLVGTIPAPPPAEPVAETP